MRKLTNQEYFDMRIKQEEDYYKMNFGTKFWILSFLTFGAYAYFKIIYNFRRLGLIWEN